MTSPTVMMHGRDEESRSVYSTWLDVDKLLKWKPPSLGFDRLSRLRIRYSEKAQRRYVEHGKVYNLMVYETQYGKCSR